MEKLMFRPPQYRRVHLGYGGREANGSSLQGHAQDGYEACGKPDPEDIYEKYVHHMKKHGFDDLEVKMLNVYALLALRSITPWPEVRRGNPTRIRESPGPNPAGGGSFPERPSGAS